MDSDTIIYYYVYQITNLLNNRQYIGSRKSKIPPKDDLGIHYFSCSKDREFIREQKENPSNFHYEIIQEFDTDKEARDFEVQLHKELDVAKDPMFYNKCNAGKGFFMSGKTHSEESKAKMTKSRTGVPKSPEHRANIAKAHIGFRHSEESKEKMKIANVRRATPETREKLSKKAKGRKRSPESIAKMVETRKKNGFTQSEETKKKISEAKRGKSLTPEHRAKIGRSGKDHPMYGRRGEDSPLYGKERPDWVKEKISKSHIERSKNQYK
jgi:hypothetical protein